MAFENYWNETHKKYSINKPTYDDWLDKYSLTLNKCKSPVLDLGCGLGNDTLYLVKKGFSVIACDYSNVALEQVNQNKMLKLCNLISHFLYLLKIIHLT